MNNKVKSSLYFASLVITIILYYNTGNTDTIQNTEVTTNTIERVSISEALY